MVFKHQLSREKKFVARASIVQVRDKIWATDLRQTRLTWRARDAFGVADDVQVGVDERAKFSNEFAFAVPPMKKKIAQLIFFKCWSYTDT